MDRISAGQEMILVRSRKQRDGSSAESDQETGREGCPWVRIKLAQRLQVNGNVCQENWREERRGRSYISGKSLQLDGGPGIN